MSPRRHVACLLLLAIAVTLASAVPAAASFHLMKIREVAPESASSADDAFVELQMYAPGQRFVSAHTVLFYNAAGTEVHNRVLTGPDPANGESQRTILIGDTSVPGRDFTINGLSDEISDSGGAVCFDASKIDCVSWGNFNNAGSQAGLPVGEAAAAIPDGSSITRSIAGGCATLLEGSDDTNSSGADFSVTARTPRPNSVTPTETACGGGGGGDGKPPQTTLLRRPQDRGADRTPTFRFRSNEAGSRFQCRLDARRYLPCASPFTLGRLALGSHTLRVRAIDRAGNRDPTPAVDSFTIVRRR